MKAVPILTVLVIIALLTPLTGAAAPTVSSIDFPALDAVITAQMAKHGLPGVALAVVENGEIVYSQGYGTAGRGWPMTAQTPMLIGSQSKSFTALALAQLAEAGKLDLDAPVRAYLPWFRVADEDASARITLNHLLHHTSGLSDAGYGVVLPDDATPEQAVRSLAAAQLTAPVGSKHQYFNRGYTTLAYIVELVSGESYADYLQAHILAPLGMTASTAAPATATGLAQGYTRLFGFPVPMREHIPAYGVGEGFIVSTAEDMARYAIAIMDEGAGLVSPQMMRRILTPGLGSYGMGWIIVDGGAKILHGGANQTFRTDVNLYPQAGRAFILLTNEGHQVDHFVSAAQLAASVEAIVLGRTPLPVGQGWSVRWVGWGLGALVLALAVLHTRNFLALRGWRERARRMTPARRALDVAISFLIPTAILIVVFWQVSAFYGNRFNLQTNLAYFCLGLPDVFVLMIVGTIPDYAQGVVKLVWALRGAARPALAALAVIALLTAACAAPQVRPPPAQRHATTRWTVQSALPLEALAFINTLTADPLVGGHYAAERARFSLAAHPEAAAAASRLAEFRSKSLGSNLSGFLYPWFMASQPRTLADLIRLAERPERLRQDLKDYDDSGVEMNVYCHDDGWRLLQQALPDVKTLLVFLQESGFEAYWQETDGAGYADRHKTMAQFNLPPELAGQVEATVARYPAVEWVGAVAAEQPLDLRVPRCAGTGIQLGWRVPPGPLPGRHD